MASTIGGGLINRLATDLFRGYHNHMTSGGCADTVLVYSFRPKPGTGGFRDPITLRVFIIEDYHQALITKKTIDDKALHVPTGHFGGYAIHMMPDNLSYQHIFKNTIDPELITQFRA